MEERRVDNLGLPLGSMDDLVSQSYIYQTPLVHDSPVTRTQSSIENLVPETNYFRVERIYTAVVALLYFKGTIIASSFIAKRKCSISLRPNRPSNVM